MDHVNSTTLTEAPLVTVHSILAVHCRFVLLASLCAVLPSLATAQRAPDNDWPAYGRDAGGARHSPLTQITRENVAGLTVAWVHRTGDDTPSHGRFQSTPLMVDGTLYLTSPLGRVNALDPRTGRERWTFDPGIKLNAGYGDFANRGVSTWRDATAAATAPCARRVFVATIDARLIALDAKRGVPCADFGRSGTIPLGQELVLAPEHAGEYQVTSPPAVIRNLVIVGSAIADNQRTNAASGVVRAYDVRTGALRWSFDPVARDAADTTWSSWRDHTRAPSGARTGGANVWSVIAADSALDLVYLPTSSPSPDYYGGERLGRNGYANSLVAVRASTGAVVWSQQLVHHDVWDYDLASPPALFTMRRNGREIPAVAQATKMGLLFMFDRRTGEPLHAIEERKVPASDVPGEETWDTQPFPVLPAPFVRHKITPDDAFGIDDASRAECRARITTLRNEGIYTPPSLRGTLVAPGNAGGSNWGGVAVDETRGIIVGAANELPFEVRLVPKDSIAFLERSGGEIAPQRGTPYGMQRRTFMSAQGVPCVKPPFGQLTAVDAATGATRWQIPIGWIPAMAELVPEAKSWGSVGFGGPITTASGVMFIAATIDAHLRALDIETGRELWSAPLPAGGFATPMTYAIDGRQYVVIAAGGHDKLLSFGKTGDWLMAFALPEDTLRVRSGDTAARRQDSSNAHRVSRSLTAPSAEDITGSWVGDLRVGDSRYPMTLTLTLAGETLGGTLRASADGLSFGGDVSGTLRGGIVTWRVPFTERTTGCSGTLEGTAEVANAGDLLSSRFTATSNCGEGGTDTGAFGLRRPSAVR